MRTNAAAFFSELGYKRSDWSVLEREIRPLLSSKAVLVDSTKYGRKFAIGGTISGPNGRTASIVTVWIILTGESFPRFVTAYPEEWFMAIRVLDSVVMQVDLPRYGLKKGDIGAVVQIYSPEKVEVEFVTGAGRKRALVALDTGEFRSIGPHDLLATRQIDAA